ncbi:MAG: rhodanese-like domain-containing protein [Chloroflexi bacterium]|nr:rhodanese-like domain-containing protein [Chloroflexota bacterium]
MARNVPGEPYTRISAEEADEMVKSGGATVIDVRRGDEYAGGHVKGALWIPVDDVIPRFDDIPTEGNLLFICEVGARSGLAAEYAAAMGADSDRLFNVEDGTGTWIRKGLPSSSGDEK